MKFGCTGQLMANFYSKMGVLIARHPGYFILIPFLLSGLLSTGIKRFHYEQDPEYLYTPIAGEAWDARNRVEKLFPLNTTSSFDPGRTTRIGRIGWVVIEAKDGGTMFRKSILRQVFQVHRTIQNITIEWEGKLLKYRNLCARNHGDCFRNDILVVGKRMKALEKGTRKLRYPIEFNSKTYNFTFYAANLGGVTLDQNGYVTTARSIRLMYFLDYSDPIKEKKALLWENAFLDKLETAYYEEIKIGRYVSLSLEQELNRTVLSLLPMYLTVVVILVVFSAVTCATTDWVRSKPWSGILGLISTAIGVISGFGLMMYCGVSCIDINVAVPFLMAGIGMDDTFVMLASWRRTDRNKSVEERLADAYSEAGVSITVTSLTNFLSFLIGISTPFPSVRIFCSYAAVCVFFTYLYQITFFGGTMAISGFAEEKQLHAAICIPLGNFKTEGKNCLTKILCNSNSDKDTVESKHEHMIMVFFRDRFGKLLSYTSVKIFVVLLFVGNLGISFWGCTQLEEGIEFIRLFPLDSYAITFFTMYNKHFSYYKERIQVIVDQPLDYSDPEIQYQLENALQKFERNRYISDSSLSESWLRWYLKFLNEASFLVKDYDVKTKEGFIKGLKDVFLRIPATERFKSDVLFNENGTEILASRFFIQTNYTAHPNDEINMLLELRKLASDLPFKTFVQHYMFIFIDQFLMVGKTTFQSISVAAAVMMVVFLFFIPSISCSIWTAFTIISIEIGVIGYMTLWNVNLDTISMISLIMCIGFSVDYAAHVSYCFITSPKLTGDGKMRDALYAVGFPVIQCGVSTILGISVLIISPSYVFFTFFKVVFLVIILAMLHSLFLLPVLLSVSHDCWRRRKRGPYGDESDLATISATKEHALTLPEAEELLNKKLEANGNVVKLSDANLTTV
ncbi:patched domain-containing protein 3-like [Centruroides sculpturatus]|uniref:patched domain-containing protein 3-like n=1 Tax=Centruroides sculpturatus TaxID=218467 RepID=UPI000C6D12C1|nr:patched domain-containing protein 3-like [Centruroides sculpturatus]XP_023221455.1 patched domain-containing protein 3-like [Centruroides sculpturatus]XP_023221456.1 patched domain-containing protein 3-like [Centruroides sculpturatus]